MKILTEVLAANLVKKWQERPLNYALEAPEEAVMQAEIDELRTALAERDAEIARLIFDLLRITQAKEVVEVCNLRQAGKLSAQRKVLEQAMEALNSLFSWEVDDQRGVRCTEAITAIQEILK